MERRRRRAILGLWSIPGVGARSLAALEAQLGDVGAVLEVPPRRWLRRVALRPGVRAAIADVSSLAHVADRAERATAAGGGAVAFQGEPAFPPRLSGLQDLPPLLFLRGPGAAPEHRLRVAMVGTRRPECGFEGPARRLAYEISTRGAGVISGAAEGVDRMCHEAAMSAGGETWAFVGAGLDRLGVAQQGLARALVAAGGTLFSEYPPWVRATRFSFLRRNRLIAAASDAVLVLRAPRSSGALETARCALAFGRPLLALPGDPFNPAAEGCNELLRGGVAALCLGAEDLLEAAGRSAAGLGEVPLRGSAGPHAPGRCADEQRGMPWLGGGAALEPTSPPARAVLESLRDGPREFDLLHALLSPRGHDVSAALTELELAGAVERLDGGRYRAVTQGGQRPVGGAPARVRSEATVSVVDDAGPAN